MDEALEIARQHSAVAWVRTRDEVLEEGWLGRWAGRPMDAVIRRLGDIALVPFRPTSFLDPLDTGPFALRCRHGSLTSAEMLVPFLAHEA